MKELLLEASKIKFLVGDRHTIRLEGMGGAGYGWHHEIVGPQGIVSVEVGSSVTPVVGNYSGPPPNTSPVTTIFTVTGLKPGRVSLILTLSRSWEKGVKPLAERIFDISVR